MRNSTFKQRGITTTCYKSNKIKTICGKHNLLAKSIAPEIWNELVIDKPKSFSFYNWFYPQIVAYCQRSYWYTVNDAEKLYQSIKEWHNNQMQNITVEISCRLQHLSMCFDSPHFTSCGRITDFNADKANSLIQNPFVFCIFTRDKRGLISNRIICKLRKNDCIVYSYYGSSDYSEIFTNLVKQLIELPVEYGGSFL